MNKQILVVEDKQAELTLLAALFKESHGSSIGPDQVTVSFARTLTAARELLRKISFDLIFLDGDLTGQGLKDEPDTLPLFNEIKNHYRDKIYCTTDSDAYRAQLEAAGCPYVAKADIAAFAYEELGKGPATYTIALDGLLVIQPVGSLQAYIGKITQVSPLIVRAHDNLAPLQALQQEQFSILQDESMLIQGTPAQQQQLLNHYIKHLSPIQVCVREIQQRLALGVTTAPSTGDIL